jgi:hypothetical protein
MSALFYKARAVALGEHPEDWLNEAELNKDEVDLAQMWEVDVRIFQAIREQEIAFNASYPRGGKAGLERWAKKNPELASLLERL